MKFNFFGLGKGRSPNAETSFDNNGPSFPRPDHIADPIEPDTNQPYTKEDKKNYDREFFATEASREFQGELNKTPDLTDQEALKNTALIAASRSLKLKLGLEIDDLRETKWDRLSQDHPALKKVIKIATGMAGGTAISIGTKAALLSLAGMSIIPATIIGGVAAGAIVGYKMAKSREHERQFSAKTLYNDLNFKKTIENLFRPQGTEDYIEDEELIKKIEALEELVRTKRILGKREETTDLLEQKNLIEKAYNARRLNRAFEQLTDKTPDNIARVLYLTLRQKQYQSDVGDIGLIEDATEEFISDKEKVEGRSAYKGGVIGGLLGGSFSWAISHFTTIHGFGGGNLDPSRAAEYASHSESLKNLISQIHSGDYHSAMQEAARQGIDLNYMVDAKSITGASQDSVVNVIAKIIKIIPEDQLHNPENIKRIYEIMSYPDQINSLFNSIAARSADQASAIKDFFNTLADPNLLHQFKEIAARHQEIAAKAAKLIFISMPSSMVGLTEGIGSSILGMLGANILKEKTHWQKNQDDEKKEEPKSRLRIPVPPRHEPPSEPIISYGTGLGPNDWSQPSPTFDLPPIEPPPAESPAFTLDLGPDQQPGPIFPPSEQPPIHISDNQLEPTALEPPAIPGSALDQEGVAIPQLVPNPTEPITSQEPPAAQPEPAQQQSVETDEKFTLSANDRWTRLEDNKNYISRDLNNSTLREALDELSKFGSFIFIRDNEGTIWTLSRDYKRNNLFNIRCRKQAGNRKQEIRETVNKQTLLRDYKWLQENNLGGEEI